MIVFYIFVTLMCDVEVILHGEIRSKLLMRLKGLIKDIDIFLGASICNKLHSKIVLASFLAQT